MTRRRSAAIGKDLGTPGIAGGFVFLVIGGDWLYADRFDGTVDGIGGGWCWWLVAVPSVGVGCDGIIFG